MTNKGADKEFKRRDERRLIKSATAAIKTDFPNPERSACPPSSTLRAIAQGDLSVPDAEDVIDHIATCAPCFEQHNRQRHLHMLRRGGGLALVCAAAAIAIGVVWYFAQQHRTPGDQPVAHQPFEPVLAATLDFRSRTAERSGESRATPQAEIPHLRRAVLRLTIKLPIGTEDGPYDIQFRTAQDQSQANASGNAAWDGNAETLITTIDLRKLARGQYTLALRTGSSTWRTYSVLLD